MTHCPQQAAALPPDDEPGQRGRRRRDRGLGNGRQFPVRADELRTLDTKIGEVDLRQLRGSQPPDPEEQTSAVTPGHTAPIGNGQRGSGVPHDGRAVGQLEIGRTKIDRRSGVEGHRASRFPHGQRTIRPAQRPAGQV